VSRVAPLVGIGDERSQGREPRASITGLLEKLALRGSGRILSGRNVASGEGQADTSNTVFVLTQDQHSAVDGDGVHQGVITHAGRVEIGDDAAVRQLYCLFDDLANRPSREFHLTIERRPRLPSDHGL
jgi:hypothetical protein